MSPSWGGVTVGLMYSFGGIAGATGSGQTYCGALGYANGPLSLAAGCLHVDNGNATASSRGLSSADSLFNSAVNQAYATARSIDIERASGQYVIGPVTVGAAYSYSRYVPDGSSTFGEPEKYHSGSAFALWQMHPAFQVIAGYNFTESGGNSSARYHQINLGADYLLSKRTDLYATVGYQHASGQDGLGKAQAVIGSYGVNAGADSQVLAIAGVRHKF